MEVDQWSFAPECDDMWWTRAREWGGGFFHHPSALSVGLQEGELIAATCVDSVGVASVAAGVRWRCRLSGRSRHAYFPSLPLLRPGVDGATVMRSMCSALSRIGVSDVVCDSFDAPLATYGVWGAPSADRAEYRVALDGQPGELMRLLSTHHTRMVHRGDRDLWTLDIGTSDAAVRALESVSQSATERGAARGNIFSAAPWRLEQARNAITSDWGVTICRALQGDTLLSAALIGWGGDRAFYLGGGSSAAGYERGAAPWMHWRIMLEMRQRGVRCYNLGGAPAGAHDPAHPSHGLHRFKTAFGAGRVVLRGAQWNDGSLHSSLHRAARRLSPSRPANAVEHAPTLTHAS